MSGTIEIPCRIYRGGTSRGVFFLEQDLPEGREVRDRILLGVLGSPDVRQIDGLGGASSQTSKAMIVAPATASDGEADVSMLFGQVSVDQPKVDWGGNCGNLTAAVGVFALDAGLVEAEEPETVVSIVSRNTGLRVRAHIPTREGALALEGEYEIPGVPGRAARIDLDWIEPGGSAGRGLVPTGRVKEEVELSDGRRFEVSIIDAANAVAFCRAADVGLRGSEVPAEIEGRSRVVATLEAIRSQAAERMGVVASRQEASRESPNFPKVAVIAPPSTYTTSCGTLEAEITHDLQARMLSMGTAHRSYAVTAAICTAVAARIPGTVVSELVSDLHESEPVWIAHPYGVVDVGVEMDLARGVPRVRSARIGRTARLLMSGVAHLPASVLSRD